MEQAKTAVSSIVGKLTDADYFNIVVFSDTAVSWKGRNNMLIQATSSNKQEAQSFVATVKATGGTNINDAMLAAIETLNQRQFATSSGIIVLLTGITYFSVIHLCKRWPTNSWGNQYKKYTSQYYSCESESICRFLLGLWI